MKEKIPDEIKDTLCDLLYEIFIEIRHTKDLETANKLGYFAHNIPGLIKDYSFERLRYFLETEYRSDLINHLDFKNMRSRIRSNLSKLEKQFTGMNKQ